MKNMKLAEKVYEDYKAYLEKEQEINEELQRLKANADAAENIDEELQIYDGMQPILEELDDTKRHINTLARIIVRYVFG